MWTSGDRALVGNFGAGQALTDDQFRLLEPLIPPAKPGGRPRTTDTRNLLDGLFYLVRTGCQWRHLPPPPAFPPLRTVYGYMRAFLRDGVWESIRHHLVVMLREGAGGSPAFGLGADNRSSTASRSSKRSPRGGCPTHAGSHCSFAVALRPTGPRPSGTTCLHPRRGHAQRPPW